MIDLQSAMQKEIRVLLFTFAALVFWALPAKATHIMGVDLTYTCTNNCTIRVHQRVYRDCNGAVAVGNQNFSWGAAAGCSPPTQIGTWQPCNNSGDIACWQVTEVTPVCAGTVTQCQNPGSAIRGVEEYYRWSDWNICNTNCNNYTIEWWGQNRNGGITSGAANQGIGSFVTTLNTALTTCNNSPQFQNPPVPYLCAGQPFTFNQGATDPDGDSLSYGLGPCFDDTQTQVIYNPGFSPTSPLGSTWTTTINPVTGDVSFIPNPTGNIEVGVMCVYVNEWRNGVVINQIVRDMQINVIACPSNNVPSVPTVQNVIGGQAGGSSTTGIWAGTCLGNNLCFNLPATDANAGDSVTIWWSQNLPGATFFQTGNPSVQDTITGINPLVTFCWTPPAAGTYSFLVQMRDNACPSYGFSQFTVTIRVSDPHVQAGVPILSCDTVTLCGSAISGIPNFNYAWSGQGGLSANGSCFTHIYPGQGTYSYQLIMSDSIGCRDTVTGTITIPNTPVANAGPDFLLCTPATGTLGVAPSPNTTYFWDPSTSLSSGTVSNPTFNITNPGLTPQTYQYVLTATDNTSGCFDRDTVQVVVSYPPQLSFAPTQVLCYGTPTGAIDMTIANGFPSLDVIWSGPNAYSSTLEDINNLYNGVYHVTVTDSAGCVSEDSVTITQPLSPLWANFLSDPICCNGATDGAINTTVTGDSPPYNFSWIGPGGFASGAEDLNNLGAGTYYVEISDNINCVIRDSVVIVQPAPIQINFTVFDVSCNGEANGVIDADVTGGNGNYSYLWTPTGSTLDSIFNLPIGSYTLDVEDTCYTPSTSLLYWEDFEGHSPWTLNVATGINGADRNFWKISDAAAGLPNGTCAGPANGDSTLHITSLANPNGGAIYQTGGNCGVGPCPQTNVRAESPFINTVGFSNLSLSFDFMSIGDNLLDNASLLYNVGAGWVVLAPSLKSLSCAPGQGRWQNFNVALPAAAAGITNLQLGFNWTNNDDGAGAAPSIAINNIRIIAPRVVTSSTCTATATTTLNQPSPLGLALAQTQNLCFGGATGSITSAPSGGNGNYSFLWSNGSTQQNPTGLAAGMYYVTMTDTAYTPAGGALGYLLCFYQDSIEVTEPTPISLSTSSTLVSCFLGSDGTASVVASGGTPGYTYLWSTTPAQTTATAVGLPTALYFVTVTDANGCPDTAQVVVSQPSPIAVAMSQINATCGNPNGSATASPSGGTPGYTYQWSTTPVQTTPTATGLLPGFYGVTVTDLNGCVSFGGITVGNEPNPSASIVSQVNVLCFGNATGSATAAGSGGTGPYTYLWSNGQTTPTATGLPAGIHVVQVADAFGCRDTAQVNITQPPLLTGTTIVQNMGCNATSPDGTIGVLPTGGVPGYTYAWSTVPLQTTQMATNVGPGIYTVTITDANGCEATLSDTVIQVPRPSVVAGPDVSFCDGTGGAQVSATGSGGTTPYFYTWSCNIAVPFCGLDSINDDDPIANPDTSNWYYVFITDVNGCISNLDSVFVTVLPQPVVDAGADQFICGDSAPCVVLNPSLVGPAPGPFVYDWSPGIGLNDSTIMNPCARPDTTTIYTLQVTDGNGCRSQLTTTDTLSSVTIHVNPIPVADAGPDRDICLADTAMLQGIGTGAGPLYGFQWSPGGGLSDSTITNPNTSPPTTTTYTLVVWSNGCPSYADTVQVRVHTIPTVDAGWDREVCLGDSAILDAQAAGDSTATYTFQWYPPIALSNGSSEDATASPDSTLAYWVVATTSWGCESAPDTAVVYVKPTPFAEAGPNQVICAGDSVQLQGSYYYTTTDSAPVSQIYYSWTPATAIDDTTLLMPTVWPSASTWYVLDLRYNTCSTSDSVLVTVVPDVGATLVADTTVICGGDSVQLSSTGGIGGASFTWFPPDGLSDPNGPNPLASPDTTTTYTLVVAEGGCGDTLSVTLSVIPRPIAEYVSSLTEGCIPHTVNFVQNSQNDVAYVWDFGDSTPVSNFPNTTHTYTEAGTYNVTLTVVNTGGCAATFSGSQVVAIDTPNVAFTSDPSYPATLPLPNSTVSFLDNSANAVSWIWEFGDGLISSDLNPTHTYQQEGTYFVTLNVTNAFGCIGRIVGGPFVVTLPDLFIPNVFSPNGDGINDVFRVDYSGSQPFVLQIFDRWGAMMYEGNNHTQGWDGMTTTGTTAPDGVYYYHVSIGQKEYANHVTLMR